MCIPPAVHDVAVHDAAFHDAAVHDAAVQDVQLSVIISCPGCASHQLSVMWYLTGSCAKIVVIGDHSIVDELGVAIAEITLNLCPAL